MNVSTASSTNYAAPTAITPANTGFTESMSWTSFLGLASDTNPNGATASSYYDAYARPSSTHSPFGATTTYAYTTAPPTVTATTNGRWSKTTLDGLGRTIKVETGHGSTTVSAADTEYAPCACSPLGKMKRTSMPYAPGATRYWTTYTYDALGRTVSVVKPDGASTTTYLYQGNTVKVTDAAGKWKLFTMDANGNLTHVTEPNPSGGANYETSYTYDGLNHLATVSMPRDGYTQTRTFTYSGDRLASATNPENGTVSYTYNGNYKIASKVDAKNQRVEYSYDSLMRLTQVRRYPVNGSDEDTCQQTNFYYDTNPFDGSYSQYIAGRLAAVQYKGPDCTTGNPTTFTEMYSYNQAGARVKKRLRLTRGAYSNNADLDAAFTYDNEGRMTQVSYPLGGPTYDYTVDSMGRLFEIKDHSNSQVITSASYGPAGELLSLNGQGYSYNNLLQVTSVGGIQYRYSATQNNGKISSQYEAVSGEEVTYTYDALNRLATAVTTDNPNVPQWGQSYSYDGFGNHVGQDVIKGTAPSWHTVVDPATNRSGLTDANGNKLIGGYGAARYDVENRLVGYLPDGSGADWIYDVSNQRVERRQWTNQGGDPVVTDEEIYFYSVTGQKLGNYGLTATVSQRVINGQLVNYTTLTLAERKLNVYFGSKLIGHAPRWVDDNNNVYHTYTSVVTDRLNSIGKYYPYGQEKNPTANDTEKFATYTRDSVSGLDYANQRYYQPGFGKFLTPDPYQASGGPADPGSWNRYAYVVGDPVNLIDPYGMYYCDTLRKVDADIDCRGIGGGGLDINCFATSLISGIPNPFCYVPPIVFVPPVEEEPWECPAQYQNWINAHGADALSIAKPIGTSEADILALSAYESGWGRGPFASAGAYFNLEVPKPKKGPNPKPLKYSTGWQQSSQANANGQYALVATYASYLDSANSFAYYKGSLFTNVTNTTTFGTIASKNGFGITVSTFVSIADVFVRCLQ